MISNSLAVAAEYHEMMLLESKALRAFTLIISHSMFRHPIHHSVIEVEDDLQTHFTGRC
jgi:hypothetical protein